MQAMKIAMLGAGRVGKTSILRRYLEDSFDPDSPESKAAAQRSVVLYSPDKSAQLRLELWDTAGQERFLCLAPMYFKDADAVLLVYSITSRESFNMLYFWLQEVQDKGRPDCIIAVVANQADNVEEEVVAPAEGNSFAQAFNGLFALVSAKTGLGIRDLFKNIIEKKYPGLLSRTASVPTIQAVSQPTSTPQPVPQLVPEPASGPEQPYLGRTTGSIRLNQQQNAAKPLPKKKCC